MFRRSVSEYDDSATTAAADPHDRIRGAAQRSGPWMAAPAGWVPGEAAADIAGEAATGIAGEAAADTAGKVLPDQPGGAVGDDQRPGWADRLTRTGPWGVLAEKWVPEPLRQSRVGPGRRGAVFLSAVAAIAAGAAAVGVWWGRPQPVALLPGGTTSALLYRATDEVPAESSGPAGGQAGGGPGVPAAPSPADSGPILVSVTGQVRHPGLVTVPADARVADAIEAAGGVLDSADLVGINLAARLVDGTSIVVAGAGSTVSADDGSAGPVTGGGATDLVNINTADAAALQRLSGVGPVTAEAIITYRRDHGPFTDLAQLEEVPGIGPVTFARIAPNVTL